MADTKQASKSLPALGLFGKLRAVSEHFDDLGGSTGLSSLKTRVYDNGIRRAIDQGVWKDLVAKGQSLAFDHWFAELRTPSIAVGRVVASRDAVGRDQFPLIGAMTLDKGGPSAGLESVASLLDQVVNFAHASEELDAVRARLAASRGLISSAPAVSGQPIAPLLDHPTLGPSRDGLRKALRALARQAEPYRSRDKTLTGRSAHVRVPTCLDPLAGSMVWARLTHALVEGRAPVQAWSHHSGGWTDILIGETTPGDLYCLRASPDSMPMITQIPYEFDDRALGELDAMIASLSTGAAPTRSAGADAGPPKRSLLKFFLPASALVVLVWIAAVAMKGGKDAEPVASTALPAVAESPSVVPPAPETQAEAPLPALEATAAQDARAVEEARQAEEARRAEEARLAQEARQIEASKLAEEARLADEARLAEEARQVEEAKRAEEARSAEQTRQAQEAEQSAARAFDDAAAALDVRVRGLAEPPVREEAARVVERLRAGERTAEGLAARGATMLERLETIDRAITSGPLRPIEVDGDAGNAELAAWLESRRQAAIVDALAGRAGAMESIEPLRSEVPAFVERGVRLVVMRDLGVLPDERLEDATPADLIAAQRGSSLAAFVSDPGLLDPSSWALAGTRQSITGLALGDDASLDRLARFASEARASLDLAARQHPRHADWVAQVQGSLDATVRSKVLAWVEGWPFESLDGGAVDAKLASVSLGRDDLSEKARARIALASLDRDLAGMTTVDAGVIASIEGRLLPALTTLAPEAEADARAALTQLEPGGAGVGSAGPVAPWRVVPDGGDSRRFVYTRRDGSEASLRFLPVPSSRGRTYVAQSELTLAQASALLESLGTAGETLAASLKLAGRLPGVVGWQIRGGSLTPLVGQTWFRGRDEEKIEPGHPLQNISPTWADALARAAGMRLASEAEWLAAPRPEPDPARDAWHRGRSFSLLADRASQTGLGDPGAGVFGHNRQALPVAIMSRGLASQKVFFRPAIDDATQFDALLGNVAEFIKRDDGSFAVIGGSILAPADIEPLRAHPADDPARPFADVGIRLAFDDNRTPDAIASLRRIIAAAAK